jgi:asparagine synthase (glutamine-hydrolysing)
MCGIAGVLSPGLVSEELLAVMGGAIRHRGPDDGGTWRDSDAGIGFAHRRLAIVDLSPHGHQPMHSADGRFVLCYNGEIYNHAAIRRELEGEGLAPPDGWRGHSDTETLLQAIVAWGLEGALTRSVGMFAFALWDRAQRRLQLVRDRFGEKPLYYGWAGSDLIFASEIKAIRHHPRFRGEIDRDALGLYLARTYIPAPLSIYRRLFKLEPGCILTVERGAEPSDEPAGEAGHGTARLQRYWSYRSVVEQGLANPIAEERDALETLDRVLGQAISDQAVADVPVGAFLSGGVDSSTIVALYQRHAARPVQTFSIGFAEDGFNEAAHAKAVAKHLGTVHHEQIVSSRDARDVIPSLPQMYDEPFADSSQIPTFLVSRFARGQVTVALTGDGGDELFAGYNRHFRAPALWRQVNRVPAPLRRLMGATLGRLPSDVLGRAAGLLPGQRQPHVGAKLRKALRVAGHARVFDDVYESFLDEWHGENNPADGRERSARSGGFDLRVGGQPSDAVRMMYCDAVSYLPDDILCKVDRASMAVSLETRVPFLDHRVAELAARIPIEQKVQDGRGKHILRELLYRHVPREMIDRPKAGFAVPVGEWIKDPLRSWAEDLLDPSRMTDQGLLNPAIVHSRWQDHLTGCRDLTPAIWAILMLQAWLQREADRT